MKYVGRGEVKRRNKEVVKEKERVEGKDEEW